MGVSGVIYEDREFERLEPLSWLRPVYDLHCGVHTLKERVEMKFPEVEFVERTRPLFARERPIPRASRTLFVNGRVLCLGNSLRELVSSATSEVAVYSDGELVAAVLGPEASEAFVSSGFEGDSLPKTVEKRQLQPPARMVRSPWDLVVFSRDALVEDLSHICSRDNRRSVSLGSYILGSDLYCEDGVKIEPFCLLDSTSGPIFLSRDVEVRSHTSIRGPAFIGRGTKLLGGKIGPGAVIMEDCRIHGELAHSTVLAHSNVSHPSVVLDSYVCSWVNVGAHTVTSNLKNNYDNVRCRVGGQALDTGLQKLGCFIGDFAKISSGSVIYPGRKVGIASHVYGTVCQDVSPFTSQITRDDRGRTDNVLFSLEDVTDMCGRMMRRRGISLGPRFAETLAKIYRSATAAKSISERR